MCILVHNSYDVKEIHILLQMHIICWTNFKLSIKSSSGQECSSMPSCGENVGNNLQGTQFRAGKAYVQNWKECHDV